MKHLTLSLTSLFLMTFVSSARAEFSDMNGSYKLVQSRYGLCDPEIRAEATVGVNGTSHEVWIGAAYFAASDEEENPAEGSRTKTSVHASGQRNELTAKYTITDEVNHREDIWITELKWGNGELWMHVYLANMKDATNRECLYRKISDETPSNSVRP